MRFKTPQHKREAVSRYRKQRYAGDPLFRLYYVNASRAQRGLPPLASPEEMKSRSEAARERCRRLA